MFWRTRPVARKTAEENGAASCIAEELNRIGDDSVPIDERLAMLMHLRQRRARGADQGDAGIDRMLLEKIARLHGALSTVQEEHGELREIIRRLTAPPCFPAVYLAATNTPQVQGALVQTDNERRVVEFGEGVLPGELNSSAIA